jgi:hypothetical protein
LQETSSGRGCALLLVALESGKGGAGLCKLLAGHGRALMVWERF